jgi:Putative DNA-binding domain
LINRTRWRESDLLELIATSTKESLTLDYKASEALAGSDSKKNEISKDVSAIANSAGGTIIYGVVEDGHVPINIDRGVDRSSISKEWLEQVINSKIQRRIDGIVVHEVELTISSPGRVAYVVTIPQSTRAPHQASDKRFYKRFNFSSVPMEEYEIRDVSRRQDRPDLLLRLQAKYVGPETIQEHKSGALLMDLSADVVNHSAVPAEYAVFQFFIDHRLLALIYAPDLRLVDATQLKIHDTTFGCNAWHLTHGIPGKMPIFSGPTFSILSHPFRLRVERAGAYAIGYQILSPGVEPKMTLGLLSWDGNSITLRSDLT